MSGKFTGQHEISSIGPTQLIAFTGAVGDEQIHSDKEDLPAHFVLYTDQDVYLRQAGSSGVDATANDFLLASGSYAKITVYEIGKDDFLSALRATSNNGTLRVTRNNSRDPGSGTSA